MDIRKYQLPWCPKPQHQGLDSQLTTQIVSANVFVVDSSADQKKKVHLFLEMAAAKNHSHPSKCMFGTNAHVSHLARAN